jgi:hypothetical protein
MLEVKMILGSIDEIYDASWIFPLKWRLYIEYNSKCNGVGIFIDMPEKKETSITLFILKPISVFIEMLIVLLQFSRDTKYSLNIKWYFYNANNVNAILKFYISLVNGLCFTQLICSSHSFFWRVFIEPKGLKVPHWWWTLIFEIKQ